MFSQPTLAVLSKITDSRNTRLTEQLGKLAVEGVRVDLARKSEVTGL